MKIQKDAVQKIPMRQYMTAEQFRTVEREGFEYPHGVREIPVIIDLSKKTRKLLSFRVRERSQIFGFVTAQGELRERFDEIQRISMEPFDDDYLLLLVVSRKKDEYYLVTEQELIQLLEGARRTPSQR